MQTLKILITGVSSGLGHALAELYLNQGASVYGCSRRRPEDLIAQGLEFESIDLTEPDTSATAFEKWIGGIDRWDLVILNAGKLGEIRDLADTPLDDLRETMEINVWSNKWLLDALFAQSESIQQVVAISSGASRSGNRGWNGYGISKAALNMLVQLYAAEQPGTHFSSLAPGLVDTAMQDYLTNEADAERFETVQRLREAKGTRDMPDALTCARQLLEAFPKLLNKPSGDFADIRKM
ncbi:MAG: SDR family NAD(P)-dependent oxidoreductase [Opitutales bacterium]|nr:SDR family NAD(P)-dependent oxidoreductase [Opitutales bacterium]